MLFFLSVSQSVSRMVFVGYGWYVLPSSTVMLLESAWTTESCSGPKGCAVSLGCCRSSTNGDRRKERYGVMSDCLRSPVSMRGRNLRCGREVNFSYLEVIQETHVGITERDLPLRCRIWDFQKTRTHEQGRTRPLHQKKKKKNNTLESPIEQPAEQWPERRVIQFRNKFDKCGDCGTFNLWVQQNQRKAQLPCVIKRRSLRTLEMSKSRRLSRRS